MYIVILRSLEAQNLRGLDLGVRSEDRDRSEADFCTLEAFRVSRSPIRVQRGPGLHWFHQLPTGPLEVCACLGSCKG